MNYLGHVFLALPNKELVPGCFLADHIKGSLENIDPVLRSGVKHHRLIDSYTDDHESIKDSAAIFDSDFGRYSGMLVDVFFDHLLAKHWKDYASFPLMDVSNIVLKATKKVEDNLPKDVLPMVSRLDQFGWLSAYKDLSGVETSLKRLSTRSRKNVIFTDAIPIFSAAENMLYHLFRQFMADVQPYSESVKLEC